MTFERERFLPGSIAAQLDEPRCGCNPHHQEITMFVTTSRSTILCLHFVFSMALFALVPLQVQAQPITFELHSRVKGESEYHLFGTYATEAAAKTVRKHMQSQGFEVELRDSNKPIRKFTVFTPRHVVHDDHVISYAKTVEVFAWMARQEDIAFRYLVDGGYARAELMIERMVKQKFHPHRVWAMANGEALQIATTPNAAGAHVYLSYNVAPILLAKGEDGLNHWYVIDPSLFKAPVKIDQWRSRQMKKGSTHTPYITMTKVGEAPVWVDHRRKPGTGYWPGADPKEGLHKHAVDTMHRYRLLEPKR